MLRAPGAGLLAGALVSALAPATAREVRAIKPPNTGVPVATLAYVDKGVERETATGRGWQPLTEGESVRTGDRIRTAPDGLARLKYPWMSLTAGPSTVVHIPAGFILSTVLDEGRAELLAQGREIIKVRTAEAEIRGEGRIIVRREQERTMVMAMALDGTFRVEASGMAVVLQAGEGTVIKDGQHPEPPAKLPEAPTALQPGQDPVYVARGEPVRLSWSPAGEAHHIQLLPLYSDEVLIEKDVSGPPQALTFAWLGTYRWRVSSRDARGIESRPSAPGYICVVEK
jgi:hypothetical protein